MKTFARHKTYNEIRKQCAEQGVPLNDVMYKTHGWDSVAVGVQPDGGYVIYNIINGNFFGRTPKGVRFDSKSTEHANAPWFQSLLAFFYVEK